MTSMPASRRARAMILAPRSCPSRAGLATTTRILRWLAVSAMGAAVISTRARPAGPPRRAPAAVAAAGRPPPPPALLDLHGQLHQRGVNVAPQVVRAALGEP